MSGPGQAGPDLNVDSRLKCYYIDFITTARHFELNGGCNQSIGFVLMRQLETLNLPAHSSLVRTHSPNLAAVSLVNWWLLELRPIQVPSRVDWFHLV